MLETAIGDAFDDFEEAVVHQAARHAGAQAIVTRNLKDFHRADLLVYSSNELVKILTVRAQLNQ